MTVYYSSIDEQQKIAGFLKQVDKRIKKLEKKKEKLEQYKKGIMQKLFSQQIRFKDEDGNDYPAWEEKKFGEVLKVGSGKDYKHLDKGNIPVYGSGGYMTSVNKYLYKGESACIGRKGTIDKPIFLNESFWTVDTLFYTHSFKDVLPYYIFLLFQRINWKKYNEASGVPSLSKTTIESIVNEFPQIEEQQKIANFLSVIDKQIEKAVSQIDSSKTFKNGLLQKMFV